MNIKNFPWSIKHLSLAAFLIVLMAATMFPSNPLENLPRRDDGVFLYAGEQVLSGLTPYSDFWDHKGPAIYYVNALGLYLGHGLRWGVWGLEYLFLLLTALLVYKIAEDQWGVISAFVSVLFFAYTTYRIGPYSQHESNYTETYSVFFNILTVYIWLWLRKKNSPRWHYLLVGVLSAASFFFRPNNIGMIMGIAAFGMFDVIYNQERKVFVYLLFALCGFLFAIFSVSVAFFFKGILVEFIDAVFFYNLKYSASGTLRISNFLENLKFREFWYISLFGYALTLAAFLSKTFFKPTERHNYFLDGVIVFAWPLEIFLISISGRIYPHYLIMLFPYLGWMMGAVVGIIIPWVNKYISAFIATALFLISFVIIFYFLIINPHVLYVDNYMLSNRANGVDASDVIVQYVRENSSQDDTVLVWGNDVWINFLSGRKSPTKYIYQYPLFLRGYSDADKVNSFLSDLKKRPPKLVVAILSVDANEIIPLGDLMNRTALDLPIGLPYELKNISNFFSENYCIRAELKDATIYQFKASKKLNVPCK